MRTFNRSLVTVIGCLLILSACSGGGSSDDDNSNTPTPNGRLYVSDLNEGRILSFSNANSVDGNIVPITTVEAINFPAGLAIDSANDYLYVADSGGVAIAVFHNASTVTGNTVPDRRITGSLGFPLDLVFDAANDRLFASSLQGINIYDNVSLLNGLTVPSRRITGQAAGVLFYDASADRLFSRTGSSIHVYDSASTTDGTHAAEVDRTLAGASTGLGTSEGMFIDSQDRLYVSEQPANSRILIWNNASTVDGDLAPDRIVAGAATGLTNPRYMFIDPMTDELYVINNDPDAVYVFSDAGTLNGNIAPARTLTGAATLLTNLPYGLTVDTTRN